MAKQRAMWLARDEKPPSYVLSDTKPKKTKDGWWAATGWGDDRILPGPCAPVELEPGGGPMRVWLASEREHAIAEAARMLVRSTKDGLDIVASGYYDEIAGLLED